MTTELPDTNNPAPATTPLALVSSDVLGAWVSVRDRLPAKNTEVLICFAEQNTLCSTGQYTGRAQDVDGWCYPWENRGATDNGDDPVVTHWMPLPAPPQSA